MSQALELLGELTAQAFMQRHWQRRPLLVRGAMRDAPFVNRRTLFDLAARDDVESRLVVHDERGWRLRHGPVGARQRPPLSQPRWTLLVQGMDLHLDAAHRLLRQFAFVPWARLDDIMVSYATRGGGVGAHTDAYDVFLLQLEGRRRWRVGPVPRPTWQPNVPLKLLERFEPTHEWVLDAGDMLYLPPGWGHEGVAVDGDCTTASIGFRAPGAADLAGELLARMADASADGAGHGKRAAQDGRFHDVEPRASRAPGRVPSDLRQFARRSVRAVLADADLLDLALGEWLTEPKPQVVFEQRSEGLGAVPRNLRPGLTLDRRTRMLHDTKRVYINGEAFDIAGHDAKLLQRLSDARELSGLDARRFSTAAWSCLEGWAAAGWVHPLPVGEGEVGSVDAPTSTFRNAKAPTPQNDRSIQKKQRTSRSKRP